MALYNVIYSLEIILSFNECNDSTVNRALWAFSFTLSVGRHQRAIWLLGALFSA